MSWLKIINVFLLQWFFIRLTKCEKIEIKDYRVLSYDFMLDGSISARGTGIKVKYDWYSIQGFILPLTGWWNDFKFLSKPFFIKVTDELEYPIIDTLK